MGSTTGRFENVVRGLGGVCAAEGVDAGSFGDVGTSGSRTSVGRCGRFPRLARWAGARLAVRGRRYASGVQVVRDDPGSILGFGPLGPSHGVLDLEPQRRTAASLPSVRCLSATTTVDPGRPGTPRFDHAWRLGAFQRVRWGRDRTPGHPGSGDGKRWRRRRSGDAGWIRGSGCSSRTALGCSPQCAGRGVGPSDEQRRAVGGRSTHPDRWRTQLRDRRRTPSGASPSSAVPGPAPLDPPVGAWYHDGSDFPGRSGPIEESDSRERGNQSGSAFCRPAHAVTESASPKRVCRLVAAASWTNRDPRNASL